MGVDTTICIAYGFLLNDAKEFYNNIDYFDDKLEKINQKNNSNIQYTCDGYNISKYTQVFIYSDDSKIELFNRKTGSITGGLGDIITKQILFKNISDNDKKSLDEIKKIIPLDKYANDYEIDYYVYYYQW
jgi:hypothetical protein